MNENTHRGQSSDSDVREHRRRRSRRNRRRALIRSIYLVPSTATLGNAICGFAAIYVASLFLYSDPWAKWFFEHKFTISAYLIFAAMVFDALDGRLARFTRHTTDFGGQLDSMADVISFGVAPAILMLQVCKYVPAGTPFSITRTIWAIGAVYACCAAIRLARFNVSNQHGEQHHFSFLGLPSPAAGGTVAAIVLMQQAILGEYAELLESRAPADWYMHTVYWAGSVVFWSLPVITLLVGLLMVSTIRYPHVVNRYVRGKKSVGTLVLVLVCVGAVIAFHKYAVAVAMVAYTLWGLLGYLRHRKGEPAKLPAEA